MGTRKMGFVGFCLALAMMSVMSSNAHAVLIDGSPGQFIDTETGYAWLKLSPNYNRSYQDVVALLPAEFHMATFTELETLWQAAPADPMTYFDDANVMGEADPTRDLIWGWYDAQNPDSLGWAWKYSTDTTWYTNFDLLYPIGFNEFPYGYSDLGAFAVNTNASPVPEPSTMLLLCSGLLGLVGLNRRRKA